MQMSSPLEVRIVWHPDDLVACESAPVSVPVQLFHTLCNDPGIPASERPAIPVRFHTSIKTEGERPRVPIEVPLDGADHVLIVALVGAAWLNDGAWLKWYQQLRRAAEPQSSVTLLPVALVASVFDFGWVFGETNCERVFDQPDVVERDRGVRIAVLRTIVRILSGGRPLKVFVSHAKADGFRVGRALAQSIDELKGHAWVDIEQIEAGQNFREVLSWAMDQDAVFVAVVSDSYSTREWCRWEAHFAKAQGLAMVVLDMVGEGQRRSLPSLGNVPVVRYNAPPTVNADEPLTPEAHVACRRVMEAVLQERVNMAYFDCRIKLLAETFGDDPATWARFSPPPDLFTIVSRRNDLTNAVYGLYPDPPLPQFEVELLGSVARKPLSTPLSMILMQGAPVR
jgi:TIR domain